MSALFLYKYEINTLFHILRVLSAVNKLFSVQFVERFTPRSNSCILYKLIFIPTQARSIAIVVVITVSS